MKSSAVVANGGAGMAEGATEASDSARVTRSASRMGAATMVSRVFGLARDTVFAILFGTSFFADAFNLAFLIPNFFRRVVGEGNLNPAFIPVFTEIKTKQGPERANQFLRRVGGALYLVLTVLCVVGIAFAGPLVSLYATEWDANPAQLGFATRLLQLMFPYLFFAGGAALASASLNANRRFVLPALAPIVMSLGFLAGAAFATMFEPMESRLVVFCFGGLAGGLGAWLVQMPVQRSMGMPLAPRLSLSDPDVVRVRNLMLPGLVALGITQINSFIDTLLALRLDEGSLSALRLGNRVTLLPVGVIGVAVATASLPSMSQSAAHDDRHSLLSTVAHTLSLLQTLLVPATVGLLLLATPIITLLFQYGEFTAERSTPMTAAALAFYALGLPAFGWVKGLAQPLFSIQDTRTPVRAAAIAMAANIGLNFLLVGPLGLRGLALATSLAAYLNAAILAWEVTRKVGTLPTGEILGSLGRTSLGTAALVAGCLGGGWVSTLVFGDSSFLARVGDVVLPILLGLGALLLAFRLVGHSELEDVLRSFRLRRRS